MSLFNSLESSHRTTLLFDHIAYRRPYFLTRPQPARASMSCPALASGWIELRPVQKATCNGLHVVHDSLWANLRCYDQMHVTGTHVGCPEIPTTLAAALHNCLQHHLSPDFVQTVRHLLHTPMCSAHALRIRLEQPAPKEPMTSIDRSRIVTVQVASVAGKGDEICHREIGPSETLPLVAAQSEHTSVLEQSRLTSMLISLTTVSRTGGDRSK